MNRSVYIVIMWLLCVSCGKKAGIIHLGENHSGHYNVEIDTMYVSAEHLSGMGNFYFKDSVITFVDAISCTFYDIDLAGQITGCYFGKGRGENEIRALMFAYPIENDPLNRGVMVDNDNIVTIFDTKNKRIDYSKKMDFGWENRPHDQYRSPSLYNISSFTDFGVSYYLDSDSVFIFPVNIVNRKTKTPDRIEDKRYEEGAIWGELNLSTMKVEGVRGRFPEIYKAQPRPHMEFFQYTCSNGLIYVNHGVDSLIYVYKYPDDLQYTIGYECSDIDRNYTSARTIDYGDTFKKDLQHVGMNTGLLFCAGNRTLCRTYIKSAATGASGMQLYKNNDLIADVEMPSYFKLLGYKDGYYYGARFIPVEDLETTSLVLYKIKLDD